MTKLVFVHGWGFDHTVWDMVIERLEGVEAETINLGFFGQDTSEQHFVEDAIYVGHSLGVLWLLKRIPKKVKAFVSIAGFDCFTAFTNPRLLQMMVQNLQHNPHQQLEDFWAQCQTPSHPDIAEMNPKALEQGLAWLATWNTQAKLGQMKCPLYALASKDDAIVPKQAMQQIWGEYNLAWSDKGGHMLPLTRPDICAQYIQQVISDVA